MIESLGLINLFVRDMQRSREFYCDLLEIPIANPEGANLEKYLQLGVSGAQIYLHWTPPEVKVDYRRRGVELFFGVADADAAAMRLRALGVTIRVEPFDLDWRPWRCVAIEDPDGYVIFLASPRRAASA